VRAVLKSLDLDPEPSTLPGDPSEFALLARMIVGPPDAPGEESFDVTVCSPEWLAKKCHEAGGIYNARHHLVSTSKTSTCVCSAPGSRRGCRRYRPNPGPRSARALAGWATGSSRTTAHNARSSADPRLCPSPR
jgi:hypothetical protein